MACRLTVLLDTSILIPRAADEGTAPEGVAAISVVTLGELTGGVLLAPTRAERAARAGRLHRIRETFDALPVDQAVADAYGAVFARARRERRIVTAIDLLIIATASATHRTLETADQSQARLAESHGVPTILR